MKKNLLLMLFLSFCLTGIACTNHTAGSQPTKNDYPIHPVPFTSVHVKDNFWLPRMKINQEVTIPIALGHCYNTGRVDNFKKAGHLMDGYFDTQFTFDDTDIYKIIEGASYSIQVFPNKDLDAKMDTLIYYIGKAQEPDGYLFTARTAGNPQKMHDWVGEKRWEKDPDLSHELYNCGHLYEAAVAHFQATGKKTLLDIAIKNADLLVKDFGPGKLAYEPGHQIVEMGLVKMYRVTGKKEYLDLAKFFLDLKGHGHSGEYSQTHKPVIEQDEAVGHAVRAAYMYSGMADVAALTGNKQYLHAIDQLWDNVVTKKLYITGGIGATGSGEAFGPNYDLPNMSAYCETCAAIANVYWNHRLFLLHGDSKYYDVLERTLYNGLISGVSLSGDHFFYPNPLESVGQHSRSEWFGCACCPSNVCRFVPSFPGYIYAQKENDIYVNLFVTNESDIQVNNHPVKIIQQTGYPWEGLITIGIEPEKEQTFGIRLRVPGWALNRPVPSDLYSYSNPKTSNITLKLNGKELKYVIGADGYISLSRKWKKGDKIEIDFPMDVKQVLANSQVKEDAGKASIERGPVVYCLEGPDNGDYVLSSVVGFNTLFSGTYISDKLNGIYQLEIKGQTAKRNEANTIVTEDKALVAIPYYAWANRGSSEMAVWIPTSTESARPAPLPTICSKAKVTAATPNKSLRSVNDGYGPEHSNDRRCPFYSLWPKENSLEWIEYEFIRPEKISYSEIYWFDDGPWGGCRIPLSWKIQYKNDRGDWQDVVNQSVYEVKKDAFNTIRFEPVMTQSVRIQFQLPEKNSVGIYEWSVR